MSLLAKIVLGTACFGTGTVIGYVQLRQYMESHYLHEGLMKDLDNQQQQAAESLYNLPTQVDITKRYKEAVALAQREAKHKNKTCPPPENITEAFFDDEDLPYIVPTFDIREHVHAAENVKTKPKKKPARPLESLQL